MSERKKILKEKVDEEMRRMHLEKVNEKNKEKEQLNLMVASFKQKINAQVSVQYVDDETEGNEDLENRIAKAKQMKMGE